MVKLRAGQTALTDKLIKGLHKGGASDFLREFYAAPYTKWLKRQPPEHVEDVGDRSLAKEGQVPGHPDFVEVDRRIAADTR
ncbi:hypothetical protein HY971_01825 [Candidatus Kaiserbacteria bacterium]|nr:hypothetical protein [Candidatus Kaiserbacteria bacterium]